MSHLPPTSCHHSCPIMSRGSDSFTQSERYYAQNFPWRILDAILKACLHQHVQVYRKWRNVTHLCKTFFANIRESPPFKSLIRYVTYLHFRNPWIFSGDAWNPNLAEVTMRRPLDPQSSFWESKGTGHPPKKKSGPLIGAGKKGPAISWKGGKAGRINWGGGCPERFPCTQV